MMEYNIKNRAEASDKFTCQIIISVGEYSNNKKNDLYQYSTELTFREIK